MKENLTDFETLFGRRGEYGSFNDFKKTMPKAEVVSVQSPSPDTAQLQNDVGLGGIDIYSRRTRVYFNGLAFQRNNSGCSESPGFYEYSLKADEVLF